MSLFQLLIGSCQCVCKRNQKVWRIYYNTYYIKDYISKLRTTIFAKKVEYEHKAKTRCVNSAGQTVRIESIIIELRLEKKTYQFRKQIKNCIYKVHSDKHWPALIWKTHHQDDTKRNVAAAALCAGNQ